MVLQKYTIHEMLDLLFIILGPLLEIINFNRSIIAKILNSSYIGQSITLKPIIMDRLS